MTQKSPVRLLASMAAFMGLAAHQLNNAPAAEIQRERAEYAKQKTRETKVKKLQRRFHNYNLHAGRTSTLRKIMRIAREGKAI